MIASDIHEARRGTKKGGNREHIGEPKADVSVSSDALGI